MAKALVPDILIEKSGGGYKASLDLRKGAPPKRSKGKNKIEVLRNLFDNCGDPDFEAMVPALRFATQLINDAVRGVE